MAFLSILSKDQQGLFENWPLFEWDAVKKIVHHIDSYELRKVKDVQTRGKEVFVELKAIEPIFTSVN